MKHENETAQPAHLGQVERGVGRPRPKRADAKPRKWFVNEYFGRITMRAVNGWDEIHQRTSGTQYFDTWEQAHAHLIERTAKRLKQAKAELPAAKRAVLSGWRA